ncbi:hypothetical protein [Bradyrhizobium sp. LMG 9283]|uniref:hypothetical protein n=1 Tax=Bradyrhizobium sp. LMG 9283 TaxID=592064 RepID=UPI00388EFAF1
MLADRLGSLRLVLAGCAAVAAAAAVALLWADKFWWLLVVALVQAAALAPTTSIADALSVNKARPRFADSHLSTGGYGAASAAFALGTLIAGQLVSPADLRPVIRMNAAFLNRRRWRHCIAIWASPIEEVAVLCCVRDESPDQRIAVSHHDHRISFDLWQPCRARCICSDQVERCGHRHLGNWLPVIEAVV